jgi:hypothetical protein
MMSKGRKGILCLVAFLGLTLICARAPAQIITGEISGTVTDPSGAVVPGATVTVTNENTGAVRTGESSPNGEFVFTALPPGVYTVKVEKAGFQVSELKSITLTANQRVALGSLQLTVGQVTQTVEVTVQGEVVNTESADAVGLLSNIQVDNLGTKGRDVMQLLRVLPGVTTLTVVPWGEIGDTDPAGTGSNGGQFGSFTPAVGGARLFWNTVTVDGQVGSNPDFPGLFMAATSMDAVAEVKVVSNNYTADYGRNPGSTIALVTKSGTKEFHGTVYGFKRHEKLNANDFFNNRTQIVRDDGTIGSIPKPIYRFGTFGFAVGGPIYIPNKFNANKDKLFFFYSEEDWRIKSPWGRNSITVPTAQERQGNFTNSVILGTDPLEYVTITDPDPTNPNPIVGNVVPPARINPNGQILMNVMPLPNLPGVGEPGFDPTLGYNYSWVDVCEIPKRLQALKLDFHPSSTDTFTLSGRRWWVDTRAYGCRSLGFADDLPIFKHHYKETTDTLQLAWTRVVSPTVVNEFNIGVVGEKEMGNATNLFGRTEANYFDPIKRSTLGFTLGQLYPQANTNDILPQAYFNFVPNGAYLNTEDRLPDNQGYPRFNLADNLSWIRGSHTFKFGLYLERSWATDGPHAGCFNGCFDFTHDVHNPFDTGWDYANAILGTFREYSESNSRKFYLMANTVLEWFGQDTWKVNRKLTLTYGARFSWFTPWKVHKGEGAEFVLDRYDPGAVPPLYYPVLVGGQRLAQNPANPNDIQPEVFIGSFTGQFDFSGMVLSSDASYPAGFRKQHGIQVSPRFGFSYDPFGNGKTAIRGGFAVMKETTPSYGTYTWSMVTNPPVQIRPHIFYGNMDTLLSRSGQLFPAGASAIELEDKVPSIYRYSLGVQRDIGFNTILDVSYVGNVGRHLIQSQDQNMIPYGARFLAANQDPTTGTPLPDDFFRPIPGYGGIGMLMNCGITNYNSLQMAMNRRFTKGLSFGVSYTWSHTLNTGSSEGDSIARYRPWRIWNYGPANFDQTHMFVLNYVWDLPKASKLVQGSGAKLVLGSIFDNWQVNGVTTLASGLPQPIYVGTFGTDLSGGGDGTRANVIARPQLSHGERTFDRWFNTQAFVMPSLPYETSPGSDQWVVDPGNASVFPVRGPGQNNWDITLMKKFPLKSETRSLQFRFEFYNAFNHTQYASIDTFALFDETTAGFPQVNSDFGRVTSTRQPRVIQVSIRLDF